jgi:hypothetical protein
MRTLYLGPIHDMLIGIIGNRDCADDIADMLAQMELRGIKGHACADPLAKYFEREFPELRWTVHVDHISAQDDHYTRLAVTTPDLLAEFIVGFDQGEYPQLVDPGTPLRMSPLNSPFDRI